MILRTLVMAAALVAPVSLMAQDAPESPWAGKAKLGYLATSGNTETSTLNTGFEVGYTVGKWLHEFNAAAVRASEDDITTAEAYDAGEPLPAHPGRLLEENLWRAQRHGLGGKMIDFATGEERSTGDAVRALLDFTAPVHDRLGLGPFLGAVPTMLDQGNGAQRQIRAMESGEDLVAMQAQAAERTRRSAEEALEMMGTVSNA